MVIPIVVIMEMNTMKRKIMKENEVITPIKRAWGYCYQYSRRFLLGWVLMLRSAKRILIRKRGLTMEIPIIHSIERRNVNVSILLLHQGAQGTIEVVGTATVRIPLDWIS